MHAATGWRTDPAAQPDVSLRCHATADTCTRTYEFAPTLVNPLSEGDVF